MISRRFGHAPADASHACPGIGGGVRSAVVECGPPKPVEEATDPQRVDVAIVGGGAAGLATAIFAARAEPGLSIVVLDGARKVGAKILVSGGGRCNVTNRVVTAADFSGGSPHMVKRILAAFPAEAAAAFFREIGVALHEEEYGKLFPDTNQARTVVEALLNEAGRLGVRILTGYRVTEVARCEDGFRVVTTGGSDAERQDIESASERRTTQLASERRTTHASERRTTHAAERRTTQVRITQFHARRVVLATGGLSLPKTGSDGGGYRIAAGLGHSLVPTTPGLAPLVLAGDFHTPLSGIAQEVELMVQAVGAKPTRIRGALLWTHFGVSGPAVLDASRHWHRAKLEGREVHVSANFFPGEDFAGVERRVVELANSQPKTALHNALARLLPARVADTLLARLEISPTIPMAHLSKELRRKLVHALTAWPLPVLDSRGYAYAEVTAGGVPLSEIDPASMASRKCPGLYLVGEILDVDGRIGGFNFQWAWSSAWVAATAIANDEFRMAN